MDLLEVSKLNIRYRTKDRTIHAVRDLSISIKRGEVVGLVGESGCGKSTFGMSLLRLLPVSTDISAEKMMFNAGEGMQAGGIDILELSEKELRRLRWKHISVIFQGSMNSLNPVARIGSQFADAMLIWRDKRRIIIVAIVSIHIIIVVAVAVVMNHCH